jgi:hypothetical protein
VGGGAEHKAPGREIVKLMSGPKSANKIPLKGDVLFPYHFHNLHFIRTCPFYFVFLSTISPVATPNEEERHTVPGVRETVMASTNYPYFDPLGEYEHHDNIYTLVVYIPKRIPGRVSRWIEKHSAPVDYSTYDPTIHHRLGGNHPDFEPHEEKSYILHRKDLAGMERKVVKLKAYQFPLDFRCLHAQLSYECYKGCYILEKEGERNGLGPDLKCEREDCNGHRWGGENKIDAEGRGCFGKKGQRLICIEAAEEDLAETAGDHSARFST